MRRAVDVGLGMADDGMGDVAANGAIGAVFVGDEERAGRVDRFTDEAKYAAPGQVVGDAGDDLAAALDRADDRGLAGRPAPRCGGGGVESSPPERRLRLRGLPPT